MGWGLLPSDACRFDPLSSLISSVRPSLGFGSQFAGWLKPNLREYLIDLRQSLHLVLDCKTSFDFVSNSWEPFLVHPT